MKIQLFQYVWRIIINAYIKPYINRTRRKFGRTYNKYNTFNKYEYIRYTKKLNYLRMILPYSRDDSEENNETTMYPYPLNYIAVLVKALECNCIQIIDNQTKMIIIS